jgi:hypothetical protein
MTHTFLDLAPHFTPQNLIDITRRMRMFCRFRIRFIAWFSQSILVYTI